VVTALLAAIPGLSSIMLVLMLVFYVFAVMATNLFAEPFPDWFGNIGRSMYTLFQVMTLEGWSMEIARPIMEKFPYAWLFFVPFIMIATFTMLNLFVAIIVSAMQSQAEQESGNASPRCSKQVVDRHARRLPPSDRMAALRAVIDAAMTSCDCQASAARALPASSVAQRCARPAPAPART
jgi:voltage-gated sodium channel